MIISKLVISVKLLVNLPVNQEVVAFYLGSSSSFGGYVEMFSRSSSGIRAVDAVGSMPESCTVDRWLLVDAVTGQPLLSQAVITDFYRILPTFYRFFGLSWENSIPRLLEFHQLVII